MELLPTEILDQVLSFVVELFSLKPPDGMPCLRKGNPKRVLATSSAARRQLAALRLTGRVFYRSASVLLFQALTVGGHSSDSLERLKRLSHSPYAAYVRYLSFEFDYPACCIQARPAALVDNIRYIQRLEWSVNDCLSRFPGLREILFDKPCSDLSPAEIDQYLDTVAGALRDVELPNLSELHLSLPYTRYLRRILASISSSSQPRANDNLSRLRHLVLHAPGIVDDHEPAVAAATQPHAVWVLRLLELAPNLETLTLTSGTLRLDTAIFPSSLRLRTLCLLGVDSSSEGLLRFLEALQNTLRLISFTHVHLCSGTWATVLTRMCFLPNLFQLDLECNGYSLVGASSSLFGLYNINGLITRSPYDLPALGAVYRHISRNRIAAGLQPLMATPTEQNVSIHQELLTRVRRFS